MPTGQVIPADLATEPERPLGDDRDSGAWRLWAGDDRGCNLSGGDGWMPRAVAWREASCS